jgi:hypothetical protein
MVMTIEQLRKQYQERAKAEREAGGSCKVTANMPWVDVKLSDGSEYYFSEHEADRLIAEVPEWIHAEDYILAIAQNW